MNSPDRPPIHCIPRHEVRHLRDEDRRFYRRRVALLVIYQFMLAIPVRYSLDFLVLESRFRGLDYMKPYIMPTIAVLVLLVWIFGIPQAFRRRY